MGWLCGSIYPPPLASSNLSDETVLLGHFEERHDISQRFATAVRTLQGSSAWCRGEHGALGLVVVDTDPAIFEEQLEGGQRLAL